jgi:hypothetical protein
VNHRALATDHANDRGLRQAMPAENLERLWSGLGGAGDEQSTGGLRVGEQRLVRRLELCIEPHLISVRAPVAGRGTGDAAGGSHGEHVRQ